MFHSLPNPEPVVRAGKPRNPWALVDLLVFGIFSLITALALLVLLPGLPLIYLIPLQALFNITLVAFIAGWVRVARKRSFIEYVHLVPNRSLSAPSYILLGATLAISVLIVSVFLPHTETPLEKLLNSTTAILVFAVFGVVVAPLLEEIIFRGFIFQVLWEIGGSRLAVAGSAVLFAAPHALQLAGNWGAIALIFVVGCILGVVRDRSKSIIPTFIVHTSYNSTIFLLFIIGRFLGADS